MKIVLFQMTFQTEEQAPARHGDEIALEQIRTQLQTVSTQNRGLHQTYLYNYIFRRANNNVDVFNKLLAHIVQTHPVPV